MQLSTIWIAGNSGKALLLFLSVLMSAVSYAQEAGNSERAAIEIVSIEHRAPLFVRSQLTPLLDSRGSIGVVDNKLVIATTAGNLQQLKAVIADTDIPARRLVVSVDFEYGGTRPDNTNQQSAQALEGDEVSFSDKLPTGISGDAPSDVVLPQPQISISTIVRGDSIDADVELFNVAGFSGSHALSLISGQWYVVNPVVETETLVDTAPDADLADTPTSLAPQSVPDTTAPVTAVIAIRVDVLP